MRQQSRLFGRLEIRTTRKKTGNFDVMVVFLHVTQSRLGLRILKGTGSALNKKPPGAYTTPLSVANLPRDRLSQFSASTKRRHREFVDGGTRFYTVSAVFFIF